MSGGSVGIGVDLGTSSCCVAVWSEERQAVEIIANDHGRRSTPCFVSFTDEARLLGEDAKSQAARNPRSTIFDALQLIGCARRDRRASRSAQLWPFVVCFDLPLEAAYQRLALASLFHPRLAECARVDADNAGNDVVCLLASRMASTQARASASTGFSEALVQVLHHGRHRRFVPEQLLAMTLSKAKATAEAYLGTKVSEIVLTTTAVLSAPRYRALEDACLIAGLNALRLVPAPTCSMLSEFIGNSRERNVCVIDVGGGTCDVCLVTYEDDIHETKAVASSWHGGRDFDEQLMRHLLAQFEQAHCLDASEDPRALSRLRKECEAAKHTLSSSLEATIELDCFFGDQDFYTRVSRSCFEELNADVFERLLDPVKKVLRDSRISKDRVDEVSLTG